MIPETTVYIPNAFTPDGDGYNNVWFPVIYDVTDYECWIYDRWGEVIFYSTEPRKGWNGTLNERDSQTGTYTYKVRFRDVQTQIFKEIVGHFNLLR